MATSAPVIERASVVPLTGSPNGEVITGSP
jgi:hypothetical protein